MKKQSQQFSTTIRRSLSLLAAMGMLFGAVSGVAYAAVGGGQVQYRSIKMSDNAASGNAQGITSGVGSGTGVTYRVTFRAASSYTIKGVVLDFCAGTGGTPFIGDPACAALTGFTVGATPTVDTTDYDPDAGSTAENVTGLGTGWAATSDPTGQTFTMTNATGAALTSGTDYTFAISGITNTSVPGTFYARLITYASDTGDVTTYAHGTPGSYQDYGGFALSTASVVQVTAKVQETLSFCVSGTTDTTAYPGTTLIAPNTCAAATAPAIILGHGDNQTLDPSQIDTNSVWSIASTNALRGLTIRMHNSNGANNCGGLSTDNGVTCLIPPINAGAATPSAIHKGVANFGMFCHNSEVGPLGGAGGPIVVGTSTCDAGYRATTPGTFDDESAAGTNAQEFGMDATSAAENVTSVFGDTVVTSAGPVSNVRNQYDFAATASNTTPAGIYKANLAMVATGTF